VTSKDGAALRDILSVVARRAPWTRVVLRSTKVQGEGAALEIASALEALGASGLCDVIIVGRGGGAIEDLWAFNEEPVARAIAACPVPVISAVGHEVDVTISDLVADLRAPTPSAAAEAVVPDGAVLVDTLRRATGRFGRALAGAVERRRSGLDQRVRRLERALERRFVPVRQALDRAAARLERAAGMRLERGRATLAGLGGRLDVLSPLSTLRRGYAVARSADGRVLGAVKDLPAGLRFRLRVADGTVAAESLGVSHEGNDGADRA
jgi:exodeoxyribonuclease VII large subunit